MQIIDKFIQAGIFDGALILAGNSDEDLFCHAQGVADRTTGRPMTMDTVFDISSISKPIGTATSVLLLAERKLLDPDRPFTDYLPEYSGNAPYPVTPRMLAAHYSGIMPDYPLDVSAGELMRRMLRSSFTSPPWTVYKYCCVNYHYLGLIVEHVSGEPLEKFAEKNIFLPLGMKETFWGTPSPEQRPRLVVHGRCVNSDPGIIYDRWARILYPHVMGNAGIFTVAADIARYARMILRRGKGLFQTDIVEREMLHNLAPQGMLPRSFGWNMDPALRIKDFSPATVFHSGSSGQTMWIDPEQGRFFIILTNLFGEHDAGIAARLDIANHVAAEIWK